MAREASAAGYTVGSSSERIVAAFLNDRLDWLPETHPELLKAVIFLQKDSPGLWNTMLAVSNMDWRDQAPMEAERF